MRPFVVRKEGVRKQCMQRCTWKVDEVEGVVWIDLLEYGRKRNSLEENLKSNKSKHQVLYDVVYYVMLQA